MLCCYLRKRQKKYQIYWYCTNLKKEITLYECQNCHKKEYKSLNKIKKKSSKLNKNERNRFSIVQKNMESCYFCGRQADSTHELIGGINRQKSIKWGLCVGACLTCHRLVEDNEKIKQKYQIIGQNVFVKKYGIDLFMKEFKRDYREKRCKDD